MRRLGFVLLAIVLIWIFFPRTPSAYPRHTIVIAGNPMTVLSWNPPDRTLTKILIPSDMQAEGTHGYGMYSFEAFWRLGEIDRKDGTVLMESMSEALGIPVTGYIGIKKGLTREGVFTVPRIPTYLTGAFRTNLPLNTYLSYIWLLQFSKPNKVDVYDFTKTPSLIAQHQILPDGSDIWVTNADQVDNRLSHIFEDERIRKQLITTAVLNTTDVPSLGTRVARLLSNLGISVISVGNSSPLLDTCEISGSAAMLQMDSAKVAASVLNCRVKISAETGRADLTIRIGSSYAKRFLPN